MKPCNSEKCNLWDAGCYTPLVEATGSKHPDLLVIGRGGDYFKLYEANGYKGIEVTNSCGNFVLAIKEI